MIPSPEKMQIKELKATIQTMAIVQRTILDINFDQYESKSLKVKHSS